MQHCFLVKATQGRKFASGHVRMGVCLWMCLSSVNAGRLGSESVWRVLSPGRVYRTTSRKWISDIILFPPSLLFYAESF